MNGRKLLIVHVFMFLVLLSAFVFAPAIPAVDAQGGVTGFANLRISNFYRAQARTAIVVTMNGTVNSTGTNQQISATFPAKATSGANITVKPAGTILILTNVATNTITFTETGTLISAGNLVLGENDSATLLSNGTNWRQIAAANN